MAGYYTLTADVVANDKKTTVETMKFTEKDMNNFTKRLWVYS